MTAVQFLIDPQDGFDAEGGYVNDPNDPGGETNYGISKRSHPDEDIKNMTLARAIELYREHYWDFYGLDRLDLPYCICVMDAHVQHRPTVVAQFHAIAQGDWKLFNATRREFYLRLVQKNPQRNTRYKNGWLNRMNSLDKFCEISIQNQL